MFIHGESYEWNAGSNYDGSVLSSLGNVVVVTINYRLGILGFFPALDGNSRGNFGLMDQVAALHWIQENIAEFGGDASNVTIFGHGFGAACVNLLMLSPMAKGLFHRAIIQSGSALSPWAIANDAGKYGRLLKSVHELLAVKFKVATHLISFGPTVDGIVIPNDPSILMADSNSLYGNYDLVFGVTRGESHNYFTTYDERHGIDGTRRDRILRTLVRNLFNFHLQEIFLTIVNEYTDWSRPTINPLSIFDSVSDALSDALIISPTIKSGLLHSKLHRNTYFYNFAHSTEQSDYQWRIGSAHGEDLLYVFGAPLVSGTQLGFFNGNFTKSETQLSELMINCWSNFARNGDPNPASNDASNNLLKKEKAEKLWHRYEEQQQYYIMLASKPKTKDHFQSHRLSYWLNLIPKLHVPGSSSSFDHHLFEDYENPLNYEGIVRETTHTSPGFGNQHNVPNESGGIAAVGEGEKLGSNSPSTFTVNSASNTSFKTSASGLWPIDGVNVNSVFDEEKDINNYLNGSFSMIVQETTYSTALSVTIAIGCSLLVLNILVFAGVFYQRDRGANESNADTTKPFEPNTAETNRVTKYQSLHSPKISDRSPSVKQNSLCSGHCVTAIRSINTDKNYHTQHCHSSSSSPSCHRLMQSASTSCDCPMVSCAYSSCNCQILPLSTLKTNCKMNDYSKVAIAENELINETSLNDMSA
ncbi:neuroligin-4: X-linked-like protein [Dinothrombium tinctorium]|uniref:Neuroligin-4: X-linked-like protein n=1 Tax=Dinothrombium tinctorium TaxID=1965070 RepID=A0A3S3PCJ4_9ACAR|nr:neuroligin-4: X-linked-like protein [Dinothrombium tinctorium]RWS12483.1 neuroligin-4: X-linked-like protein [Dinothrombium tinctorium]